MHVEEFTGSDERLAVAALCLDSEALGRVAALLPDNPFPSKFANIVTRWCISHHKQFGEAPGPATLTAIYSDWARNADKASADLVGRFLGSLQPVAMRADYVVELIHKLISRTAAKQLADNVTAAISNGNIKAATDAIQAFKLPELSQRVDYLEPFTAPDALETAFEKTQYESIIKFPADSALGQWLGPTLHRDALVILCGADKSGKSSHLAGFCQRALIQGLRVAYLNIGDLSQEQVLRRWSTAWVGKPARAGKIKIPTAINYSESKELTVESQEQYYSTGYTVEEAKAAWAALAARGDANRFRLHSTPADTMTVEDIRRKLSAWADKGWVPDVLGIDYAGLISKSPHTEGHEAHDHIWKNLRAISSEFKILLITASQVNKEGYSSFWLGKTNFTGSKGIWAHANAAIGINMSEFERNEQVTRLNYIVLREQEFLAELPSRYVAVAGCPHRGRFHLLSRFI